MKKPLPSQAELRKLFTYDSIQGVLVNSEKRPMRRGCVAGNVSTTGYIQISVNNQLYMAHRLIWVYLYGQIPDGFEIDHIDHNKENNRSENLRLVDPIENQHNKSLSRRSSSGVCGVIRERRYGRWYATIGYQGKQIHLGSYVHKSSAVRSRRRAEQKFDYHHNHGARSLIIDTTTTATPLSSQAETQHDCRQP